MCYIIIKRVFINVENNIILRLMEKITANILKEMMNEAYIRIGAHAEYLDEINFFPVPDGDTGHNMRLTMESIYKEIEICDNNILSIVNAIKHGAFKGAKGNSGVILSQFLVGFVSTFNDNNDIDTDLFIKALENGSNRAYKSVINPQVGTILTVAKKIADTARRYSGKKISWNDLLKQCFITAQDATMDTINELDMLKKAGVVDAGALGLVYLIQGWLFVIENIYNHGSTLSIKKELEGLHSNFNVKDTVSNIKYQYCTEAMISASKYSEIDIRKKIERYGDSLLVIKEDNKIKVHIHSNNPKNTIRELSKYGNIIAAKIDDMKGQVMQKHKQYAS